VHGSALATHTAIFGDGAVVLLISPTLRQSVELGRKVVDCLSCIEPLEELTEDNKTSLTLKRNGSRVVALPGHDPKTLRGYSAPALIVEDESAFVSDETHAGVVPMLAASPNGRLILLSTPNLTVGHFYEIWHGSGSWERYEVPTRNCPRVSLQWLDERRREDPHKFIDSLGLLTQELKAAIEGNKGEVPGEAVAPRRSANSAVCRRMSRRSPSSCRHAPSARGGVWQPSPKHRCHGSHRLKRTVIFHRYQCRSTLLSFKPL
jgi:hypothetical protein